MKVSVVINYCSNEKCFIDAILTQCMIFSDDIVVSYGDKLYDNTPEDLDHINTLKNKYSDVKFVMYNVDLSLDLSKYKRPTAYWHNLARWTGVQALNNNDWVFILDADEIPEGRLVKLWLEKVNLKINECYKLACFWYFKDPTFRANMLEDSILLIHHKYLTKENLFDDFERDDLIKNSKCDLQRQVKGQDNAILFHHQSWVRSKRNLEHKLRNWGHASELGDVDKLVNYIFKDDNVNDIIHNYTYVKVYNKYNIKL
jgi:hypothetical protein